MGLRKWSLKKSKGEINVIYYVGKTNSFAATLCTRLHNALPFSEFGWCRCHWVKVFRRGKIIAGKEHEDGTRMGPAIGLVMGLRMWLKWV